MSNTLRDSRVDPHELENSLQLRQKKVSKGRVRVREHGRAREARDLCRDDSAYMSRLYTFGTPVDELARLLDEWAEDFVASVRVRQEAAGGAPDFLANAEDRRLLLAAIDLVFVATSMGRMDIARGVLTHAAVEAVPSRVLDALATIHDVSRPTSESEVVAGSYDPWLDVVNADPQMRQEAFERFVRGWRAHGEEVRSFAFVDEYYTGAWAYEAVVAAEVFGLDDGVVRDVPEYPSDLADYASEAGLPRLGDVAGQTSSAPASTTPTAIAPETRRDPVMVSGEPTLSDVAKLLSPVGGEELTASDGDSLLDAAVDAGTLLPVDARALDPSETGELLQLACRALGLAAPGRIPDRLPTDPARALSAFDAWLEDAGVRLLSPATDTDDLVFFPVLAADYETFGGHRVAGFRLRTMEQVADDET